MILISDGENKDKEDKTETDPLINKSLLPFSLNIILAWLVDRPAQLHILISTYCRARLSVGMTQTKSQ